MTTLEAAICDRMDRGMLFEIYCAAYCAGQGVPDPTPHSDSMRQLLWLLADRHRMECPPVLHDELPGWLLSLSRQRGTIEPLENVEGWPE